MWKLDSTRAGPFASKLVSLDICGDAGEELKVSSITSYAYVSHRLNVTHWGAEDASLPLPDGAPCIVTYGGCKGKRAGVYTERGGVRLLDAHVVKALSS